MPAVRVSSRSAPADWPPVPAPTSLWAPKTCWPHGVPESASRDAVAAVPQRSTATPPVRPTLQRAWVPSSRAQPPTWVRLREVRDEEAPHSRKVRPRAQRQPNTSPNQQLRRAGLPRRQTSTQPRVCKTGTVDAVRQHQIARPGVGGARAVRVQQAGVKTDHSRPRQIGPRSVDGGSVSDSQADSAGSIPVTRSKREKRCSTGESDCISHTGQRSFASGNGTRAITRAISHLGECPWRLSVPKLTVPLIPVTRSTGESVYRVVSLRPDSAPPGGGGYGRHGVIGPWPGDDHNDVLDAEGRNLRTPEIGR